MKKISFNKNMEKLENIVAELESAPLELEKALQLFEDGMKISVQCQNELEQANSRISLLVQDLNGELKLENM